MSQQVFFTREAVLNAVFEMTRESGWPSVSARSIAKRLGSSTMPIYSSLKSMADIERETRTRADDLMREYQARPVSGNSALDMAIGYVTFARQESHLFRFLYLDAPERRGPPEQERHAAEVVSRPGNEGLRKMVTAMPELGSNPVILKSWIFVHGLASLLSSGALDLPDEQVRGLLQDAGAAFIDQETSRKEGKESKDG
jgi:AcrR family transcriptional regulator